MGRIQSGFEKLEVFRLAESPGDAAWDSIRGWSYLERDTVGKQLARAPDSVGANIAEGYGRGTDPDDRRCVRIAIGSLDETKFWLRRAFARGLLTEKQVEELSPLINRLLPMLDGYL